MNKRAVPKGISKAILFQWNIAANIFNFARRRKFHQISASTFVFLQKS